MPLNHSETSGSVERWKVSQVLLGLFIVWQVLFIVGNSFLRMIRDGADIRDDDAVSLLSFLTLDLPKDKGPGYQALRGLRYWGEITGQEQGWSLFAPGIEDQARFLHTVLYWKDGGEPMVLPSLTEPADLKSFFRWGHSRLRKYESYLGGYFHVRENETYVSTMQTVSGGAAVVAAGAQANARWQRYIQRRVWQQSEILPGYLLCRWRSYKEEHPDCPEVAEIQMHILTLQVPRPGTEPWFWQQPVTMPFARIRLNADGSVQGGVQPYNPLSGQFDNLKQP